MFIYFNLIGFINENMKTKGKKKSILIDDNGWHQWW